MKYCVLHETTGKRLGPIYGPDGLCIVVSRLHQFIMINQDKPSGINFGGSALPWHHLSLESHAALIYFASIRNYSKSIKLNDFGREFQNLAVHAKRNAGRHLPVFFESGRERLIKATAKTTSCRVQNQNFLRCFTQCHKKIYLGKKRGYTDL